MKNLDTISIILMVSLDGILLIGLLIYYRMTFSWESLQKTEAVASQMFQGWRDEIKVRQNYADNSQSLLK